MTFYINILIYLKALLRRNLTQKLGIKVKIEVQCEKETFWPKAIDLDRFMRHIARHFSQNVQGWIF